MPFRAVVPDELRSLTEVFRQAGAIVSPRSVYAERIASQVVKARGAMLSRCQRSFRSPPAIRENMAPAKLYLPECQ